MNIKELKEYIEDLPDEMSVIVDDSPIRSYGKVVQDSSKPELVPYFNINSQLYENKQAVEQIRKKERYLRLWIKRGLTRDEAKEKFMDKYIRPFTKYSWFGEISTKGIFNYESEMNIDNI